VCLLKLFVEDSDTCAISPLRQFRPCVADFMAGSRSAPRIFLYKNRISRAVVNISLASYEDFKDDTKVAEALETFYLREIYYNEQSGYRPTPRGKECAQPTYAEKA
jgi:hypothetical protein